MQADGWRPVRNASSDAERAREKRVGRRAYWDAPVGRGAHSTMMRCYEGAAYFPIHDIYTGTHFMFSLFSDVNTKAHKRKNGERIFIYIIIYIIPYSMQCMHTQ